MELLLGCGSRRDRTLAWRGRGEFSGLVTLDINPDHKPDVVWDLESPEPLPFPDDTFDELHAAHVLEHVGGLGDWRFFFRQWSDFWRILKPGGEVFVLGPNPKGSWVFGDPGHTRVISFESLIFLNQPQYTLQVGKTPLTDYRFVYKADFDCLHMGQSDEHIEFVLKAIKPSRISLEA